MKISFDKIFGEIENPPATFAENLTKVGGEFYSINRNFMKEKIVALLKENNWKKIAICDEALMQFITNDYNIITKPNDFEKADAGINFCKYGAANTGSIIIASDDKEKFRMNIIVPNLIFICNKNQIVKDIQDAIDRIKNKGNFPKLLTGITGPSRTADIEKTLIMGMHGPKRLIVFSTSDAD